MATLDNQDEIKKNLTPKKNVVKKICVHERRSHDETNSRRRSAFIKKKQIVRVVTLDAQWLSGFVHFEIETMPQQIDITFYSPRFNRVRESFCVSYVSEYDCACECVSFVSFVPFGSAPPKSNTLWKIIYVNILSLSVAVPVPAVAGTTMFTHIASYRIVCEHRPVMSRFTASIFNFKW